MIEVQISDARRDVAEYVDLVANGNEQIVFTRRGKGVAALVSLTDIDELLQQLEDEADAAIVRERLEDDVSEYIPHEQVVANITG